MPTAQTAGRSSTHAPSLSVLHDVLTSATEPLVAARLHVSIRTLRRYAAGELKMNWVTRMRLEAMAAGRNG
jgi:hypothetical protein